MEKLITEVVKNKLHVSTKKDFEETLKNNVKLKVKNLKVKNLKVKNLKVKNLKVKNLKVKIPINNTNFTDEFQHDYISPKIYHHINTYSIN